MINPKARIASLSGPRFGNGARIVTGFGDGTVLSVRPCTTRNGVHWRYRVQLDDGDLADVAESGCTAP